MKTPKRPTPPRWAERFLSWYCRPELLEDLQGDLHEFFEKNVQARGKRWARIIYIIDVLKFFRVYTVRSPRLNISAVEAGVIRSYVKTSGRSILRHKLFAGINIIGLSISMCVGLLVITFLSDLYSYDDFHENKNRIYRITTSADETIKLASSSLAAGKKIRQTIPGVESVALLRRNFGGDATVGATTVPISGLWADESFFQVFSFKLLKGNRHAALKKPYSLLLTEVAANKLFGNTDILGKMVRFDTVNYIVTGILQNVPKLSHMKFEAIASLSTVELSAADSDGNLMSWNNFYSNYAYVVLAPNSTRSSVQAAIDKMSAAENKALKKEKIQLKLQPLKSISIGSDLGNEIGPTINSVAVYILIGLAFVVIISACFNYTNLSIARSLNRSREVGIRKVIGALKGHVTGQFITESIMIALLALVFSFLLFLLMIRPFLSLHPFFQNLVTLTLSPQLIGYFLLFAIGTGFIAGILPAVFYSRISAKQVLSNAPTIRVFRHVNLRKALIVVQYTFSLIFIATTIIGYNQYKGFINFDLGFKTENILNIRLQGNSSDLLVKELSAMPAVKEVSKSLLVSSLGSIYGTQIKYNDPVDSGGVHLNVVDEHYLNAHSFRLLAGNNFRPKSKDASESEVIVNEQLLKRFNIGKGSPQKAIGEAIEMDNKKLRIVGVVKDFHYGTLENKIEPTTFRYSSEPGQYVNVKIATPNIPGAMTAIADAWRKVDKIHPLDAKFYDDQIEEAYSQFLVITKVVGFFSLLAVCIASMGLFGMVVYTTERRLKEISIRKVMGASEQSLIYLMSKSFLLLLVVSALIALPATWLFFDRIVLAKFAYHLPLRLSDQLFSFLVVMVIACLMIGLQTLKVARSNPAKVLTRE